MKENSPAATHTDLLNHQIDSKFIGMMLAIEKRY